MATFVNDTFTDTNGTTLASHTGETGATWTKHPSYTPTCQIAANAARATSTTLDSLYTASGSPATAEYDSTGLLKVVSLPGGGVAVAAGVCFRWSTVANTGYLLHYNLGATAWELYKGVAGAFTLLGSFTQTLSVGSSYTAKLQGRDAAKKAFIDGVERISSADNAVTAAGQVAIRTIGTTSDSAGIHFDSITGTDAQTTITGVVGTATADGLAPAPVVAPDGVAASATAAGVAPTPVVEVTGTVGAATADGVAPAVSTAGDRTVTAEVGEATASMPAPTITSSAPVVTQGGLVGPAREFQVEAFLPIRPPTAVAVASMPAPTIVITETPGEQAREETPPPLVRRVERPEPAPVSASVLAPTASVMASFVAPVVDAESFERALARVARKRITDAEEEAMVLSMFG